jgi:glycosyltransferase involved in cell wall biosynthesis
VRIAQVAPIARPVTRDAPSSIEQLVWLLCEDLVRRGHEVTLFATGGSRTSARLCAHYETDYRHDPALWDNWQFHELTHSAAAFERAADFDVVHSHLYAFPAPLARLVDTPVVHTDHLPTRGDVVRWYAGYPELRVVALSEYHRRKLRAVPDVAVIHNGIDVANFPFGAGGDYLLFLGHLIPRKGPVQAIRAARKAGMRLVLAGGGGEYFETEVAPLVDGDAVVHVGRVGVAERNRLLAGAAALVFPSVSAEPFGLVMIEAMACGTPVAALARCAVPEIVEPGVETVTGFYADDVDGLADAIGAAAGLDRARVRAEAERRFDHRRMAGEYQRLYERVLRTR